MDTLISKSPEETLRAGNELAAVIHGPVLIAVLGEMGAGKTHFIKGLAAGFGITENVHSPTFALMHEYRGGRLPMLHMDLYRLETEAAIQSSGLLEYLRDPKFVLAVEWFERLSDLGLAPEVPMIQVRIECPNETSRRITYETAGA